MDPRWDAVNSPDGSWGMGIDGIGAVGYHESQIVWNVRVLVYTVYVDETR